MSGRILEPNYSEFAFRSGLARQAPADVDEILGRFILGARKAQKISLTDDEITTLITSSIVGSPFSYKRPEFGAPVPIKTEMLPRPADPMYSGAWGLPVQTDIPPEPNLNFRSANLKLFGIPLSRVNRFLNDKREHRAQRDLIKQKQEWDLKFAEIKNRNQRAVLQFETNVRESSGYKSYLAEDRRWLERAANLEAEYQAALQRCNYHREEFEKAGNKGEWF